MNGRNELRLQVKYLMKVLSKLELVNSKMEVCSKEITRNIYIQYRRQNFT